jgi:magnesium transporter
LADTEAGLAPASITVELDDALVQETIEALDREDDDLAAALVASLHPADQADLLELLTPELRARLIRIVGVTLDPDTLTHLDEEVRDQVIDVLGPEDTSAVVAQLDSDDAIEVLSDLDAEEQAEILAGLPPPERSVIEEGLAYPDDSAGRLMQREVVAVPESWTVSQTIDYLRAARDLPDEFYDIFLIDPANKPVGAVPLSRVLRSPRTVALTDLRSKELRLIPVATDQEKVAYMFRQYGLVSAPVVGDDGRLLGVVTVDDVVDVIQEEAEDDILKLGGVQETDLFTPPMRAGLKRLPWLMVNLGTALLGAGVISHFSGAIERVVALAVLMPMVASLGGNAGTQAMTVAVRSLAAKELTGSNALRTLGKEFVIGLLNGSLFLALGAVLAMSWFGQLELAAVFGVALALNLIVASCAGVLIPLGLNRLGLDPAVSSGVFLTCVTDILGFFAFLGLAVWFLF